MTLKQKLIRNARIKKSYSRLLKRGGFVSVDKNTTNSLDSHHHTPLKIQPNSKSNSNLSSSSSSSKSTKKRTILSERPTASKPKPNPFHHAIEKAKSIQGAKQALKLQKEKEKQEWIEKKSQLKKQRKANLQLHLAKTKKGQPKLDSRMEAIYQSLINEQTS